METPNTTQSNESKLHFLDYWRIIRIRKTVIFAVFMLVVLTTTIVTYWLPKYYDATVKISIEKDASDIAGLFGDRQPSTMLDPYFIQSEFEKIQSQKILYQVISTQNLNQAWANKYNNGTPLETQKTFDILKRRLDVRQIRNTSFLEIRVLSDDPVEAADLANEVANVYRSTRLAMRQTAAAGGIKLLSNKLASQDENVKSMQTNLAMMRETNQINDGIADSGQINMLEPETLRRFMGELISAKASHSQMEELYKNLTNMSPTLLREAIPTACPDTLLSELLLNYAQAEQQLTSMKKDYADLHPNVERIRQLLVKIDQQIEKRLAGILTGLKARVESLNSEVLVRSKELDAAKSNDIVRSKIYYPYSLYKKDLESEKRIRETLKLRITQEEVDASLPKTSIAEVFAAAEPKKKAVSPNIKLNIALGVIVGLIVGIGLAFFIEYLDTSVKTIDDVERALQAPVLGVIPQNVGQLLAEGPDSPHAEAYRVLRTNLLFSRKQEKFNTITVVSGGAGEGKSTTVFNLATVFAQNGQRVLVVDSDLRRPSLHKFMKVSNSLGLTNYLLKQKTLEEVVQTTSLPTLDFLPSGKLPSSSMGILNSVRMREFINDVRQRYDVVFFDSPPIMGVSDASVLASEVDMTLLVVQYRKYPQAMTIRAKQMVEKVGGKLMGVVLNNINISQDSYYYYYSGYYYDYYSKRDEDKDGTPKTNGKDGKPVGEQAKLEIKQKF
jgi:capsular exopolysaccharide synthesis family protein